MSDLTPGHVFASGETLTPARLNDLINFAQINPGAVTPEMLAAILDLSSKTLTLPNLSVTAAMLAAALDLSGKTLTMPATVISGLPAITSLEDTDYFWFWDATDSSLKKVSKATLTAAFQPAGTVLNKVYVETTARTTAMGAIIPNDDSVPQISEGTEILSLSITPKSASNTILVMSSFMLNSTGYGQVCALFRAGTNDALDVGGCYNSSYAGPGS